jgi:hypothetical protein
MTPSAPSAPSATMEVGRVQNILRLPGAGALIAQTMLTVLTVSDLEILHVGTIRGNVRFAFALCPSVALLAPIIRNRADRKESGGPGNRRYPTRAGGRHRAAPRIRVPAIAAGVDDDIEELIDPRSRQ